MRRSLLALLCILGGGAVTAVDPGKQPCNVELGSIDDELNDDEHFISDDDWEVECDDGGDYWEYCAPGGASASCDPVNMRRRGGRPPSHEVDEGAFVAACIDGLSINELADEFGVSVDIVKKLRQKLGCTRCTSTVAHTDLPSRDVLVTMWEQDPSLTIAVLANTLGITCARLRRHFQAVSFSPHRLVDDEQVVHALEEMRRSIWCSSMGVNFADARLRTCFGIVARRAQILRCLKHVDPTGHTHRQQAAAKTRYEYNVAGPRSLYHCDAHEKLAKIWGFWIHLCMCDRRDSNPCRCPPTRPPVMCQNLVGKATATRATSSI
jgi:hypothetical protein